MYVVVCGPLENLTKFYVILNLKQFPCENLLHAVERCFHCLKALGSFPKICSQVWAFLERLVYHIKSKNYGYSGVTVPIAKIEDNLKLSNVSLLQE